MNEVWKETSDPRLMQTTPLVSVAMFAYNHSAFIAEAIEGVAAQKAGFTIELVIGVDQSQDSTLQIALQFQKRCPELVRVLAAPTRLGMHQNCLSTLGACRGKYVALCEGDDFWIEPEKLAQQIAMLEIDSDVSGCFHDCYDLNQETGRKRLYVGNRKIERDADLAAVVRQMNMRTCSMVFRNIIPAVELERWLPRTLACDYMLVLLVARRGVWRYINRPMAVYRRHRAGLWVQKAKTEQCCHTIDFFDLLLRSGEFSEIGPTIAARKRDAIRDLSMALASEGRLAKSIYQYLRSVGPRRALAGEFITSSRYGILLARKVCARVGLEATIAQFWRSVARGRGNTAHI